MGLTLTTGPAVEPVSLAEAKKHLEIAPANTVHDDHLTRLIKAARESTERLTRRAWIDQTWKLTLSRFPECIELPRPPLSSFTSLAYVDSDGASQTLVLDTDYLVRSNSEPAIVATYYNASWPTAHSEEPEAVTAIWVAGYGATSADVPEEARQAILLTVTDWFMNRGSVVTGTIVAQLPMAARHLLAGLHCGMKLGAYGVTK